jgi:hypothetical protein
VRQGSVADFQRSFAAWLQYISTRGGIQLTSQNTLYKEDLKGIAATFAFPLQTGAGHKETTNGCLFFVRRLALAGGFVTEQRNNRLLPTPKLDHFLALDTSSRIDLLWQLWRDTPAWNSLRHLPSYERGQDIHNNANPLLVRAHQTIFSHIAELGSGYVSLPTLINRIHTRHYDFLMPDRMTGASSYYGQELPTPYNNHNSNIYGAGFKDITSESQGWEKVEAALITHLIAGPLFWMGLVDLTFDKAPANDDLYGNLPVTGYRLTPHGSRLLLGEKAGESGESGTVAGMMVQPNFDIVVFHPASLDILMALDMFTSPAGGSREVSTFQLTRETVYRGQQAQWGVARILDFLTTFSTQPVPDNVRRSLHEWDELHNRIVIHRNISLAQTEDAAIADQLLADWPQARPLSPTVIRIDSSLDKAVKKVRTAGHFPLVTRDPQDNTAGSVEMDEEGGVRLLQRVPSVYTLSTLANLTIPADLVTGDSGDGSGRGQRRFLPAMLRNVTSDGKGFAAFLKEMAHLNNQPLTSSQVVQFKAWTHYYGDATQARMILLRFRDQAARNELCDEPELKGLLEPFSEQLPLARVSAENLDRVHTLLARRGIEIDLKETL